MGPKKLLPIIRYLASFGIARAALFAAPIIFANTIPKIAYGKIEFAQAVASTCSIFIGLGLQHSIPLILISKVEKARWDVLLFYFTALGATIGIAVAFLLSSSIGQLEGAILPLIALLALTLQGLWSISLRAQGRNEFSLFLDGGFWLTCSATVGICIALGVDDDRRLLWVTITLSIYGAILLAITAQQYWGHRAPFQINDVVNNIKLGFPLMLMGLLAMLVTTSGRLLLGTFGGTEMLAEYAVLFRATSVAIVGHQLLMVAMFRNIFTWPITTLRRRVPIIPATVILGVIVFWIASGFAGWVFGPRFVEVFSSHEQLGLIILAQCILWSAIAVNDTICNRTQISSAVFKWCLGYFAIATSLIAVFFLLYTTFDLKTFVYIHSILMLGYFIVQCSAMRRNGVQIYATWATSSLGFVGITALVIVTQHG